MYIYIQITFIVPVNISLGGSGNELIHKRKQSYNYNKKTAMNKTMYYTMQSSCALKSSKMDSYNTYML